MPPCRSSRIAELEREIRELEASLPAHSVPASMLIRLEELEEKLQALRAKVEDAKERAGDMPCDG
jgi:chromosome segregation ATPase